MNQLQPQEPQSGFLSIKLVPSIHRTTAAAGAALGYSFTSLAPPRRAVAATDAGHGIAVAR